MIKLKAIALVAALSMLVPPARVQARDNTAAIVIGAAIVGAALASSSSRNNDHRYRGRRGYGYRQPQYYQQQPYYSNSRYNSTGFGQYPPADLYRSNSGLGYDRFGAYTYDTGRYGNSGYYSY